MKYQNLYTDEIITESDMMEQYKNYAYWTEFDGERKADSFEQWLNTTLEQGEWMEVNS